MSSVAPPRFNPLVFLTRLFTPSPRAVEIGGTEEGRDRKSDLLCAFAELSMASHCIVGGPGDYYVHLIEAMAAEAGKEDA